MLAAHVIVKPVSRMSDKKVGIVTLGWPRHRALTRLSHMPPRHTLALSKTRIDHSPSQVQRRPCIPPGHHLYAWTAVTCTPRSLPKRYLFPITGASAYDS